MQGVARWCVWGLGGGAQKWVPVPLILNIGSPCTTGRFFASVHPAGQRVLDNLERGMGRRSPSPLPSPAAAPVRSWGRSAGLRGSFGRSLNPGDASARTMAWTSMAAGAATAAFLGQLVLRSVFTLPKKTLVCVLL